MKSPYKSKNVLVTGGAGFIGSHVVEKLVELGAHVRVLDSSANYKNLAHVQGSIEYIRGDIVDYETCVRATNQVDVIFHLAAFISVTQSFIDQVGCFETNVVGTRNVLEAARVNGVKHVVFSSTAAVYGNLDGPCTEKTTPRPASPYAVTKLEGEHDCVQYAKVHGISIASLRYFNVFGERQELYGEFGGGVVAAFAQKIKAKQPVTIFGSGKQTRDFVHVSEVVQANLTMGLQGGLQGEAFNIASGRSMNLLELIEKLEGQYGAAGTPVTYAPARQGDILYSHADVSKYEKFAKRGNSL